MKVRFLTDEKRMRGKDVAHSFKAGASYEVRDDVGRHFIKRQKAVIDNDDSQKTTAKKVKADDGKKSVQSGGGDNDAGKQSSGDAGGSKAPAAS